MLKITVRLVAILSMILGLHCNKIKIGRGLGVTKIYGQCNIDGMTYNPKTKSFERNLPTTESYRCGLKRCNADGNGGVRYGCQGLFKYKMAPCQESLLLLKGCYIGEKAMTPLPYPQCCTNYPVICHGNKRFNFASFLLLLNSRVEQLSACRNKDFIVMEKRKR